MLKRRPKERPPRQHGLSISRLIPNAITVAATCAGLTGIRFAIEGAFDFAAAAILLAAILDGLDGGMARLLNATTDFGSILDSLSDFVAFGVSPGFILYYWLLNDMGGIGWAVTLFFAICCGLRLARFNSSLDKLPVYAYNYFQGVPAPAGAALGLLPLFVGLGLGDLTLIPPVFVAIWAIFVSLLMVSNLPTFSFKKVKIPRKMFLPALAIFGLAVAMLIVRPWPTLTFLLVGYGFTIPYSVQKFAKLEKHAQKLKQEDHSEMAHLTLMKTARQTHQEKHKD